MDPGQPSFTMGMGPRPSPKKGKIAAHSRQPWNTQTWSTAGGLFSSDAADPAAAGNAAAGAAAGGDAAAAAGARAFTELDGNRNPLRTGAGLFGAAAADKQAQPEGTSNPFAAKPASFSSWSSTLQGIAANGYSSPGAASFAPQQQQQHGRAASRLGPQQQAGAGQAAAAAGAPQAHPEFCFGKAGPTSPRGKGDPAAAGAAAGRHKKHSPTKPPSSKGAAAAAAGFPGFGSSAAGAKEGQAAANPLAGFMKGSQGTIPAASPEPMSTSMPWLGPARAFGTPFSAVPMETSGGGPAFRAAAAAAAAGAAAPGSEGPEPVKRLFDTPGSASSAGAGAAAGEPGVGGEAFSFNLGTSPGATPKLGKASQPRLRGRGRHSSGAATPAPFAGFGPSSPSPAKPAAPAAAAGSVFGAAATNVASAPPSEPAFPTYPGAAAAAAAGAGGAGPAAAAASPAPPSAATTAPGVSPGFSPMAWSPLDGQDPAAAAAAAAAGPGSSGQPGVRITPFVVFGARGQGLAGQAGAGGGASAAQGGAGGAAAPAASAAELAELLAAVGLAGPDAAEMGQQLGSLFTKLQLNSSATAAAAAAAGAGSAGTTTSQQQQGPWAPRAAAAGPAEAPPELLRSLLGARAALRHMHRDCNGAGPAPAAAAAAAATAGGAPGAAVAAEEEGELADGSLEELLGEVLRLGKEAGLQQQPVTEGVLGQLAGLKLEARAPPAGAAAGTAAGPKAAPPAAAAAPGQPSLPSFSFGAALGQTGAAAPSRPAAAAAAAAAASTSGAPDGAGPATDGLQQAAAAAPPPAPPPAAAGPSASLSGGAGTAGFTIGRSDSSGKAPTATPSGKGRTVRVRGGRGTPMAAHAVRSPTAATRQPAAATAAAAEPAPVAATAAPGAGFSGFTGARTEQEQQHGQQASGAGAGPEGLVYASGFGGATVVDGTPGRRRKLAASRTTSTPGRPAAAAAAAGAAAAATAAGPFSQQQQQRQQDSQAAKAAAAAAAASSAAAGWRDRANASYKAGQYKAAEEQYTRALEVLLSTGGSPEELAVLYSNRGGARLMLERPNAALKDALAAISSSKKYVRGYLRAASCYMRLGDLEAAGQVLGRIADMASASNPVWRELSQRLAEVEQRRQQLAALRKGVLGVEAVGQLDASGGMSLGATEALGEAEAQELAQLAQQLAEVMPFAEEVAALRAWLALRAGDLDAAALAATWSGSVSCDWHEAVAHQHQQQQGDGHSSLGMGWEWWIKAQVAYHQGNLEDAQRLLKEAVLGGRVHSPPAGSSSNGSSSSWARPLGALVPTQAAAEQLVEELLLLVAKKEAGNAALRRRQPAEAVQAYGEALAVQASLGFAAVLYCNRAAAHHSLKAYPEALADCGRALALKPDYVKAHSRMAQLLVDVRRPGLAADILEALLKPPAAAGLEADARQQYQQRLAAARKAAKWQRTPDHYHMLGLERSAAEEEVRKAFKKLALRHHPDKAVPGCRFRLAFGPAGAVVASAPAIETRLREQANALFNFISSAHEELSDRAKRRRVDQLLDVEEDPDDLLASFGSSYGFGTSAGSSRYGRSSSNSGSSYGGGFARRAPSPPCRPGGGGYGAAGGGSGSSSSRARGDGFWAGTSRAGGGHQGGPSGGFGAAGGYGSSKPMHQQQQQQQGYSHGGGRSSGSGWQGRTGYSWWGDEGKEFDSEGSDDYY